jgi:hypothetical protein
MKNFFKDMLDQAWTLVGLATGWLVLEGTAKDVVGKLILATLAIWIITYPLRRDKSE